MNEIYQTTADFISLIDDDPTATIIVQDNQYLDFFVKQLNQDRLNKGKQAWLSPNIHTIGVWSKELWNQLHLHKASLGCDLPKLLDPLSERLAFGKLVHKWNEKHNHKLLNVEGTSSATVKCWRLLCQYNCTPQLPHYAEIFPTCSNNSDFPQISQDFINHIQDCGQDLHAINEDHNFFIDIAKEYCQDMEEASSLSGFLLPNALIYFMKLLPPEALPVGKRLIFANFIEYTYPQLTAWQQALTDLGFDIETPIYKNTPAPELNLIGNLESDKVVSPFENFEEELAHAVSYIKSKLQDPDYSAALIVPQHNETIYRMLDKYINPQVLFTEGDNKRSYKASSGLSLLKTPLGSDLSTVILFAGQKLNRLQLLSLVQDSFIYASQVEFSQRCHLYEKIRQDQRSEYCLKDLYDLAQKTGCIHLANLAALTAQFTPQQSALLCQSFKKLKENYRQVAANAAKDKKTYSQVKAKNKLIDWPSESINFGKQKYPLPIWIDYCRTLLKIWFNCPQESNAKLIILTYMSRLRSFCTLTNYYSIENLTFSDFRRYLRLGLRNVKLPISEYTEEASRFNVLNLRKALRRHFTELILLEFNSEAFPAPVKYQGFIPQQLLADLGWPQGSASLCLKAASEALQTLRHCADRVILSFANNTNKNDSTVAAEVSPLWKDSSLKCTLISNYNELDDFYGTASAIASSEAANTSATLKETASSNPLAIYGLSPWPSEQVENICEATEDVAPGAARPNKLEKDGTLSFQGGVKVISSMANCPLQALLCHRLGCSSSEDEVKNGFDTSLDRGNLLHKCLQKFWEEYKQEPNSQGLSSRNQAIKSIFGLDEVSYKACEQIDFHPLETKIKDLVHQVLQAQEYKTLSQYVLDNEEKAATATLLAWLKYELNPHIRQDFNVVALEQPITLAIRVNSEQDLPCSELVCSGTIDRIDELQYKQQPLGQIIIDYKTGNAKNAIVNAWDPSDDFATNHQKRDYQLPLYAFASGQDNYRGLLFAKLKTNTFVGKADFSDENIKANLQNAIDAETNSRNNQDNLGGWGTFKANCQDSFQTLATQYLQGNCQRTKNKTLCNNCQFKQLCHIGGIDEVDNGPQLAS